MADDDLDILQQLLELADEDDPDTMSPPNASSFQAGGSSDHPLEAPQNENVPPNKRPRLTPAKPAAQAFKSANVSSMSHTDSDNYKQAPVSKSGTVEKFSGLRMKNACFPSIVLKERLSCVPFQKLSQARSRVGATDKWATIAVLTEKGTKESASGRPYSIWRLSDLQGTNVSLFLFGKAQTGLWKESEGSVIAVFHPEARIAESKFTISVDSEQQVVKLGTSCDMGFCRAKKKDGTACKNAVNINTCPFCDYHVQGEFNKIRSKRSECKGSQLHRAFNKTSEASLGSHGRPKMSEGGDIIYTKPPTMKPRSQQQLQQAADAARKSIPGVSRLLASVVPGQTVEPQRLPATSATPTYGPLASLKPSKSKHHHPHQPGSSRSVPSRSHASQSDKATAQQQSASGGGAVSNISRQAGANPAQRQRHADVLRHEERQRQEPQMLMLQEDEMDWGGSADAAAADPALQHALAVIKAKGGLEAPDPNRPFQRRSAKAPTTAANSSPVAASPSTTVTAAAGSREASHCTQPPNCRPQLASKPDSAPGSASLSKGASAGSKDGQAADVRQAEGTLGTVQSANVAGLVGASGQRNTKQSENSAPMANATASASASGHTMSRQAGSNATTANATAPAGASEHGRARQPSSSATTANAAKPASSSKQAGSSAPTAHAVAAGSASGPAAPVRNSNTAQNRVLAKLGLSKGGQQGSRTGRVLPSTNPAPSSFAAAFGSVAAEMQSTAQTDTMYKDLVEDEDHDRLLRVMTALEKKDEMQQRMEAITKLTVTAFQCKTCGTTTERRMLECRQHDVQRVSATKRWWQCCHCNNRFTTVGVRMPKTRCPKCNDINMDFKAVSMARSVKDKSDPAFASRIDFKARGVEHAFSLNG